MSSPESGAGAGESHPSDDGVGADRRAGLAGTRIGPYEVQELLGTGGFAAVYRAHDPRLRSDVALKVLADIHALNADIRERFVSEGHLLRRIDNPAGLQVYDIGETDAGNPFLVLELADRGDLESRVSELRSDGWRPGPDDVLAIVSTLAEALGAFHDHDVVHRDVKPGNLLITSTRRTTDRGACSLLAPTERLLLADLGLAKDLAAASGLTVAGGSAGYAASEQMRPGSIVDTRADVFAASAVVAWLLSGRTPRDGSLWEDVTEQRFAALVPALRRGLDADPEQRPPTIGAWTDELTNALDHTNTSAAPPMPDPSMVTSQPPARPVATPSPAHQPPADPPVNQPPATQPPVNEPPVPSRSLPLPALAAAALIAALVLVGAVVALTRGPDVERLDDGRARVVATVDDASIAIVGPDQIEVGEVVRYQVELSDIERWTLIGPDGVRHDNTGAIDVSASSSGAATVQLTAVSNDGDTLETELPITVVQP